VGSDSAAADFEILLMMRNTLLAIGVGNVTIRLNHRGLFNRFLDTISCRDKSVEILHAVDKLAKAGRDATVASLSGIAGAENTAKLLAYIEAKGSFEQVLACLTEAAGGPSPESERLSLIRRFMNDTGTAASFVLDPSITRGLDYYTGVVYETFINELPEIGSVCSGGRYDDLAGLYSKQAAPAEKLTGVGSSIGLDRLIAALETLGKTAAEGAYVKAVIACVNEESGGAYQALAEKFRGEGAACEVFPEAKKLTRQFVLAEKKGAKFVIIPGEAPLTGTLTLRELGTRKDRENLSFEEALGILRQ
jgi:histidyl-tRNA synthetase